ncbi:N-6 DNA methylase [Geitlerinema sp. PCC 9228]|uniref:Eco57I restriction-modification methylase domain-containing protein n=1 Tax=Geitlerinema sp. PCC 9228 TaxID=111611 RepID=UPI000B241617|nr:N-6 DNA methylase [Geitlerinema sp. PCC 9228]
MSAVTTNLTGVQIEGNLIAPDMTEQLLEGDIKGQSPEDFGLQKSDKLADEIATAWGDARAYWDAFRRRLARLPEGETATSLTREYWAIPLLELLGYQPKYQPKAAVVEGQTYAISHRAEPGEEKPPVHIVGARVDLEKRPPSGTPRLSAHGLVQEYLNRTEHLWAIATNGLRWRLLRDSSLMTRLTYIEFDLEQILEGENFAEFGLFFRLFHRSRLPSEMDDADECLLEYYHQEARQQGGRIRDRLRNNVEAALVTLGTGFLQRRDNHKLREQVETGELTPENYYRQLLRLIYRLLFLMVAESRELLFASENERQLHSSPAEKARIYREYYSMERLRALAERPTYRREGFQDLWQGLRVTFALFDENWRGELLNLSPLNGDLFGEGTLENLDTCAIDNHDLSLAIRHLSLYEQDKRMRRVNYGALDVEELGSIYESLLDFRPQIEQNQGFYEFRLVAGGDRKSTGSYYTPPELVGQLVKSALEPVIAQKLQGKTTRQEQETALLELKVCDPACGSGHFLLAAARRIGKELAQIQTGESHPGPDAVRQATRQAIQHCIYGVDMNPLAVDLCKVALWIEGFYRGYPLTFLDHRIRCGNSLVGVLDLDCLHEGIPDKAYKPVTGDEKKTANLLKKRNKGERGDAEIGQLSLEFEELAVEREQYTEAFRELDEIEETSADQVRQKQAKYRQSREEKGWWRDNSACNLWTAAFFMPLTEQNLQWLPTTAALNRVLREDRMTGEVVEEANKLAEEKNFFHWPLEFPEVFEDGGFDCVMGNPPWERIKLQEKEFFASRDAEIAKAKNSAARKKLIERLPQTNPKLAQEWEEAKQFAEAQGKFVRESGRFPLTSKGDINTYAVFAETDRNLVGKKGRAGIIVPTGIVSDDTTKKFFEDLIENHTLNKVTGFENEEFIFPAVANVVKFCILTINGKNLPQSNPTFCFYIRDINQLNREDRYFTLTPDEIKLMNPNTLTCPVFRTSADAEITKQIYQRVPVLENESKGQNPWGISFMRMFDMSNDSDLFKPEASKNRVPLYEAKMFHHFNHRWGDYAIQARTTGRGLAEVPLEKYQDPNYTITPRYWIEKKEVENRITDKWNQKWLLGWRDICRSSDERTVISSLIPIAGCGDTVLLMLPQVQSLKSISCLLANLNSIVLDFVARQKVGGTHLKFFTMRQLPILPPEAYSQEDIEFISSRVLELVYTAWDMQPFAKDMGYDGEPFIWDEQRRAKLRAELDAKYAKLYGLTRDELRYILDPKDVHGEDFPSETFRVLKDNEIKRYGEYRTRRLVLAAWDMQGF